MPTRSFVSLFLATLPAISLCYTWPSPKLDELESLRFEQSGYRSPAFANGVTPCTTFVKPAPGTQGIRSNTADWVRTAYHDMATHNVEDGTGGLDGSIRFPVEQARSENAGDGFKNTISFLNTKVNRHFSVADGIAILAIIAIENCGGPEIPFRGGRIDAAVPNSPGVPEPQQDLDSHIASFARQGFTQDEMIGLVACGHSFGSVQHSSFPEIVPAGVDPSLEAGATFDSTFTHFDNNIATEYISGTTQNPLVTGANDTTNSDKRIFSSDGNLTMNAFATSPQLFASTCRSLFARMLDTVPAGVELSEVLEPFPVKPADIRLTYHPDGTIALLGEVRLWNVVENNQRVVTLKWLTRDGNECPNCAATLSHASWQRGSAMNGKYTALWYGDRFGTIAMIDPMNGFGKFWFEVRDSSDAAIRREDQGGKGFLLPTDGIMFSSSSCSVHGSTPRVHVAVRSDIHPSRILIEANIFDAGDDLANAVRVIELAPDASHSSADGSFIVWSTQDVGDVPASSFGIVAEVGGNRIELPYTEIGLVPCA